jgi:chaperonin GroES
MITKVLAKHDKVILKPIEIEEEVSGRIVLSDIAKEKANFYKVVAIGPGVTNAFTGVFTPVQYSIGDEVFVYKVNTNMIEVDGEEYYITKDSEILCYIKELAEVVEDGIPS